MENNIKTFNDFLAENTLNETGTFRTGTAIKDDLKIFLNDVVVPKSKGYVKNERDGALLLADILKQLYDFR